jgi:hypothetical protein
MSGVIQGFIARLLPSFSQDGNPNPSGLRSGARNELYVMNLIPKSHMLADEGSYFIGTNPVPGTPLLYNIQTAFSDTVPFLYMYNADSYKSIYLDYIKIIVAIAAASGVQAHYAIKSDGAARTLVTNNALAIAPISPNSAIGGATIATLLAQNNATASALAASSAAARVLARGALGGTTVVGDELIITSGSADIGPYPGLTAAQAVCPGRKCSSSPPIIIGPRNSLTMYLWFPSNITTGLSYELEAGWWER